MFINKPKAQNAAEAAVLQATKDLKQANLDSFGAKLDVLGLFGTASTEAPTGLIMKAKQNLADAYTSFLQKAPNGERQAEVGAWVAKVAPDVQKSVNWYMNRD